MTDTPARTEARETRGRWPGIVWAVPVAALLLTGYLGLRALAQQGLDVKVIFPTSGGAQVGDTKVIYQGVEVGRVTKIEIDRDAKHVDMVLRMTPRAKEGLRTGTKFWLVGAKPSLTDVSSLKAVLAGVTIGVAPGPGAPTRRFVGLDSPPAVNPGAPGRYFKVNAEQIGSMRVNSGVYYHGLDVGKVSAIDLAGPQTFEITIFVAAPYDRLVRPDSLFWMASPVEISLTGEGLSTQFAPSNAAIAGGVEFNTPAVAAAQPESPAGSEFVLYSDHGRAIAGGRGPQVVYAMTFKDAVGDLDEGSPVKLAGRQVGAVKSVGFSLDPATGRIDQPVQITLRPQRLNFTSKDLPPETGDWRAVTDAAMARLVARGYRVKLVQNPPLIGPRSISFELVKGARVAALGHGADGVTVLPTSTSGDVASLADRASDILDKVDQIPLAQIGDNVRRLTANLNTLTGSPKVKDSLDHLDSTLNQVDAMVREVKPQVGPLVSKLNTAADQLNKTAASANTVLSGEGQTQDASLPAAIRELTDAARSIRALTDYLGRHPEAVLKGKVKDRR